MIFYQLDKIRFYKTWRKSDVKTSSGDLILSRIWLFFYVEEISLNELFFIR